MNAYEEKQEAKRQRYLDRAQSARTESRSLNKRASDMASIIPMGQPILVGHHSEKSDRRYRGRISDTFGKAYEASKKADYYADKAASVGTGGISSDDPDAVKKLTEKLERLQNLQEKMKLVNKAIRKNDRKPLQDMGYSESDIDKLFAPDFCGRIGFPPYRLQNNNAEIRRLKQRIEHLQKVAAVEPNEEECDGYTYKEEDNRCQFVFDGKPEESIRSILKGNGFRWSPSRGAWVRQYTANGCFAARRVKEKLNCLGEK